jgi:hypothetical protein
MSNTLNQEMPTAFPPSLRFPRKCSRMPARTFTGQLKEREFGQCLRITVSYSLFETGFEISENSYAIHKWSLSHKKQRIYTRSFL